MIRPDLTHTVALDRRRPRLGRTALRVAAVACLVMGLALGLARPALAASPAHSYWRHCFDTGYYGRYVNIMPTRLDPLPGVGLSVVDGSGTYRPTTHEFIYFRVDVYSATTGRLVAYSARKRIEDGILWPVQAFDASIGYWKSSDTLSSADWNIGASEVGVRVPAGTYLVYAETYWEPATTSFDMTYFTNPNPHPGGLTQFDYLGNCTP